jgi:SAM-dependent methyltransferase
LSSLGAAPDVRAISLRLDPEAADLPRLKEVLRTHGFLEDAGKKAFGAEIGPAHLRVDLPLYLRRLAEPTPLHSLIKLFSMGQWVPADEVRTALDPVSVDDVAASGLLERGPRGLRARVGLSLHQDLLLVYDVHDPERPGLQPDHVLGTNTPAVTLDCLTVRRRSRATLDLGCGGGVQSLRAAAHSDRVVATDKNPRALAFARFNARLNGVAGLDLREGDLFEPVAGEKFDLIVCNPPYVISPESRYVFQDGGRPGDTLTEEVVRRAPDSLEEGGFATVLANWALRAGQPWDEPLREWVRGNGCDAWLLHGGSQDGLTYAALWNRGRGPAEYGPAIDRWTDYYREVGLASIGMGAVILRRRGGGANWIRTETMPNDPVRPAHEEILRVFAAHDRLAALPTDEAVLAQAFRLVDNHVITQKLRRHGDEYAIESASIELDGGLRFRGAIDSYTLHLLRRCDGTRPLAAVADEMAQRAGSDRGRIGAVVAEAARRLAGLGFLVPVTGEDGPAPQTNI